jgi:hypothetical protein
MDARPVHFYNETIEVQFDRPPVLEKTPVSPDRFLWRGTLFSVLQVLSEWRDYQRKGRMGQNMRSTHASTAERRGSWGVGVFYFRVLTDEGRVFDLYYDRAPKGSDHRKGEWFLFQELSASHT